MRRAAPWLVAALGVALCAAGVAVTWVAERSLPDDLGWLPYEPRDAGLPEPGPLGTGGAYESRLTLTFDRPWPAPEDAGHLLGPALVVAGLVLLCGLAGRGVARRWPGTRSVAPVVGGAGAVLLAVGVVVVLTTAPDLSVTYAGSYVPLTCTPPTDCATQALPVQLGAAQLVGLVVAVLGATAVAGVAGGSPGRRAVHWSALGAGALLAPLGVVLAAREAVVAPALAFLSPEQYDALLAASRRADAGRLLVPLGLLLVVAAATWLRAGRRPARGRRAAAAALAAGVALGVVGAVLLWSVRAGVRTVDGAVVGPPPSPVGWTGLVVVLVGGALLGAGARLVAGRRLAG